MRISYRWLKEFVDIRVPAEQVAEDLTRVGIAVETIENAGSDIILQLDLTTNRPDCLSHLGVARELSTVYHKELRCPSVQLKESEKPSHAQVTVEIESPELCARYCARVIF